MVEFLTIIECMILNRLRGGGWFAARLPGRALFWVVPFMLVEALTILSWQEAVMFTLSYFMWAFYAWGRWFDLDRLPELTRPIKIVEQLIERVSFGSDRVAFTVRMVFASPFLGYFSTPVALIFPPLCTAVYEFSWRIWPNNPIPKAELLTGGIWGIMLLYFGGLI